MNKKNYILSFVSVCLIGILSYWVYRISNQAKLNFLHGDKKMYKVEYQSFQNTSSPQFGLIDSNIDLKFEAILNFKILDIQNDKVKIAFQFSNVLLSLGDKRLEHLERVQSQLFLGTWTSDGEILEWITPYTVSKKDEFLLLQNILLFQVILKGNKIKWTVEESDSLGHYLAKYNVKSDLILKSKVMYKSIREDNSETNDPIDDKFKSNIQISYFELLPAKNSSWLKSASFKEKAELYGSSFEIKLDRNGKLGEIQFNPDNSLLIWKENLTYDEFNFQLNKEPKKELSISEETEKIRIEKEFKNENFLSVFNKYFTNPNKFTDLDKMEKMKEYLSFFKEEALKIPDLLLKEKIKGNQVIEIIHLLAMTGHKESQKALVSILQNPNQSANARMQSIVAFQEVRQPITESIDSLWKIYDSRNSMQDRDYSNTAVLALGTAALNTRSQEVVGKESIPSKIKARLLSELEYKKIDPNKIPVLLDSIGNTSDSKFFPKIKEFSTSENKVVRSSVYGSVANFKDKESLEFLRTSLSKEDTPDGRGKIVESLIRRNAKGESIETIKTAALKEPDVNVRTKMIEYLIQTRLEVADYKKTLEKLLETETNDSVRNLLYQGIYAK